MIRNDEELQVAEENVRRLKDFLREARKVHPPDEYKAMSRPFLRQLMEREHEILQYLASGPTEEETVSQRG